MNKLMLKIILVIILMFITTNCNRFDEDFNGNVKFTINMVDFINQSPNNARTDNISTWEHIYIENMVLKIININNNQEYFINFNPNIDRELTINIPYGEYKFESISEGGILEEYLPIKINGIFTLNTTNTIINMKATTEYGLVTLNHGFVSDVKLHIGVNKYNMTYLQERGYYYKYIKGGTNIELNITENIRNTIIKRNLLVESNKH